MKNKIIKSKHYLSFLSIEKTENKNGYLGAILVTDTRGVPVEFRCTYPIKPTLIQKPLYGESFLPFIGSELCGKPLLDSLENKPGCIFVNSEFLLHLRPKISLPLSFVRETGKVIEVSSKEKQSKPLPRERLESPTGKFQPMVINYHPDYKDDRDKINSLFGAVLKNFSPLEPFIRIKKAVEVLAQQDSRFQ